ncbi:MAG TPA: hypothetical protein VMU84_19020 [Thermoanaerobaculia bacterium]|nr:hypothetical protein [Thermoanaerobaculia bacterium]
MTSERARAATLWGRSLLVGTVDAKGIPACCRAVGVRSNDDLATITVFVPVATSRDVIANIASTRRIAVVTSFPPDHVSVQLKGTTTGVRLAADDDEAFTRGCVDAFAEILHDLGIPRRIVRSFNHWPAFAIDMTVDEVFEQTPGPKAGTALR